MRVNELVTQSGGTTDISMANDELVYRIKNGETQMFELLMRRLNRRLYLVARSILRNDSEVEDVLQDAYIKGWQNMAGFRGPSGIGAWFSKIVRNEALMRKRRDKGSSLTDVVYIADHWADERRTPESDVDRIKVRMLLELAIEQLPCALRTAFVLREVEQLSVKETAESLDIDPTTVKTRVHRAKKFLKERLNKQISMPINEAFPFAGSRCDRIVSKVMGSITTV